MKTGRRPSAGPTNQAVPKAPMQTLLAQADALVQKGIAHHQVGDLKVAETLYLQALRIAPAQPDALNLLGVIAHHAQKYQLAVQLIDKAIQIYPKSEVYFLNRGNALHKLHQFQLALESFDQSIRLKPDYAEAFFNRGLLLHEMKQYQVALDSYDKAIALQPNLVQAYLSRGSLFRALLRYQDAIASFSKAAELAPNPAHAYNNCGNVLLDTRQLEAALECYDKALQFDPNLAQAYSNRGLINMELNEPSKALEDFQSALRLQPDLKYIDGMSIHMKRHLCDWENAESDESRMEELVRQGKPAITTFCLMSVSGSPALQKQSAEIYVQNTFSSILKNPSIERRSRHEKIRIGYFSADFQDHPVSYLMAELFELHDREKFEIFGLSISPESKDEMRARLKKAMDRFIDVRPMADAEITRLSRSLELDIAVDLNGLCYGNRTRIFVERAAPIQVNYIGYPATMGAAFMDYIIADETLIPEESRQHYSEKVIYMPDSFQANDSTRSISTKNITREDQGLPETGFVFCCFNNSFKITPRIFDVWMRILGRVEGSVLWLYAGHSETRENLRKEAERRGISRVRLIFTKKLPLEEHLKRQQLADLFLDTLPFNAGATASPALWAGLPVLTCMGEAFAGRMAASLLRAIGMPDLVTTTEAEYEERAVEIGTNPALAQELKDRLWRNRLTTPLFDTAAYTRNLESAYAAMYERHHAGLAPDHIHVVRDLNLSPVDSQLIASRQTS